MVNFTSELQVNLNEEADLVKMDGAETTTISLNFNVETTATSRLDYYKPFQVWFVSLFQKQQVL